MRREERQFRNHALICHLELLWEQVPDQRFGQLVMNLSRVKHGFADTWEWNHDEWDKRINEALETWAKPAE